MYTHIIYVRNITFCKEIHRLLQGTKLNIIGNNAERYEIIRYYQIKAMKIFHDEDEAIELVDQSFRKAVKGIEKMGIYGKHQ